jgi:hypothetical protein
MASIFGTRAGFFLGGARFLAGITSALVFLVVGTLALAPRVDPDATTVGCESESWFPGTGAAPASFLRPLVFISNV